MTTQRDLLAALVREFDDQDDYDWSKPAHESPTQEQRMADFLLARGVRVVDQGERVISAATAEAVRDVVRSYLADDHKALLGACADLSADAEEDR